MFRPILDRVLIKQHEDEEQLPSGLYIPQQSLEAHQVGTVIAVGPLVDAVKVDDVVSWPRYEGDVTDYGLVMAEEKIVGVIEP